jgi:adenine nucleotide transporter 17
MKIDIIKYALDIIDKQGISSLYNGVTSSLVGSIMQNGVYFCATKFWKYVFEYMNMKDGKLINSIFINLLAAIVTTLLTNPLWVLNVRMTNRTGDVFIAYNI